MDSCSGMCKASIARWQCISCCVLFGVRLWSTRVWIFLEDDFWYCFRIQKLTYFPRDGRLGLLYSALCLVQQRIHALRQSTAAWDFHGVSL